MKKMSLFLAIVFLFCLLAGCGGGAGGGSSSGGGGGSAETKAPVEDTGEVYEWKLGTIYSDPASGQLYNAFGFWVRDLCAVVEERTEGRVKITPFYDSVLGTNPEMYEQMRRGELDVFCGQPMSTVDSRFGIAGIPYVFTDYEMVNDLFSNPDGEMFKIMSEVVADNGGHLVSSNNAVFRGYYSNGKAVMVPDDVKGIKMRIYEDKICQTFWDGLCAAVIIPYSEMFMSIQTGVVDATEHTASAGITSNLFEILEHFSTINWQWTWGGPAIVNQAVWDELPDDLKVIVADAFWEASNMYNDNWATMEGEAKATMAERGMSIHEPSETEIQQWVDYARSIDGKLKDVVGADFWDKCMKIIDDYKA